MSVLTRNFVRDLDALEAATLKVIPWSAPVLCFGSLSRSKVATLGLNPSNREFVDSFGTELDGLSRRFPTLKSLGLTRWAEAEDEHIQMINACCEEYFQRNPYDGWFKKLEYIISGANATYYDAFSNACHLDLIPFATACKWSELASWQRTSLLKTAKRTLGSLLINSSVQVLVLNGSGVVELFQKTFDLQLQRSAMPEWSLARGQKSSVPGYSYKGIIDSISGTSLKQSILILGYNHNVQSSFGVTKKVTNSIRDWVAKSMKEMIQ